jgi:hypothetical protein
MSASRLQRLLALVAVTIVSACCAAPAAQADIGETIILRCTHGQSLAGFSQSAYQKALKELSADSEEYSPCSGMIRQAQLAAAVGTRGGGTPVTESSTPLAATPSEARSVQSAAHAGSAPVAVGSSVVHPGVIHANVASALSSLPTPLLATLALLLACLLGVGGNALRSRIRGRRAD